MLGTRHGLARESPAVAKEWKPRLAAKLDLKTLTLSPVEGFTLSRVDGFTTVRELAILTQQPPEQVQSFLERLVREGAVAEDEDAPPASAPSPIPSPAPSAPPTAPSPVPSVAAADEVPEPEDGEDDAPDAATAEEREATAATHRKLFETRLHALEAAAREQLAGTAQEPELSALCFDPLSPVVIAVLENPQAGLVHARLVAAHHRAPAGLERVTARADFARDAEVQRLLLRNPQLTETQLKRVTSSKRLIALWKLSVSREVPERNRAGCSRQLRTRFQTAAAEERVELILSTEGRALAGLSGLPVDGKTTSLLCKRTYSSSLLVQNIARWAAAPPALIAHLLRQPMVMKQPHLRSMVSRHPNAPSEPR